MKLTRLHIQGFRSLVDCDIPLRPLMVMIGPNGSGKTALLEVFQLLQSGAVVTLGEAIERFGGLEALLSKIPSGPDRLRVMLTIDVESQKSTAPMSYRFELLPRGVGYVIPFERLEWQWDPAATKPFRYIDAHYENVYYTDPDQQKMTQPTWAYDKEELALAQAPRMYEEPESLRSSLAKTRFYSFLDVSRRAVVRLPQPLTPIMRPGADGENLYSALYNLSASFPDIFERVQDVLRTAYPCFDCLRFPVVGAGQVTMTWHQDDLTTPLYPNQLSEGTLRFLWLTTILLAPDPPPIILIDEPEVSLHPQLLMLLAGLLQDAALRGQVIVATHSSDLIHWLQPDEVVVLDKVDGRTTFTWADTLDLGKWLDEYSLRDLWLMGNLGGRS